MADPLSVAGLAAGLVSLSFQVTTGINEYLDALKCRAEELESVRTHNQSIRDLIVVIEGSVAKAQSQHHASSQIVIHSIQQCNAEIKSLEDLVAELAGCDTGTWRSILEVKGRRLRYAFDRSKIQRLSGRLCQAKGMLGTALQVLGVDVSLSALDKATDIEAVTRDISTDLLATRSEVASLHHPLTLLGDQFQAVGQRFDHFHNSLMTSNQVVSSQLHDGTRAVRGDIQATHTLISVSSNRQTVQLEDIADQSAAQGKQLQHIMQLLQGITQVSDDGAVIRMRRPGSPGRVIHRLMEKPSEMKEICDDLGGPPGLQRASALPVRRQGGYKLAPGEHSATRLHSRGWTNHSFCICNKRHRDNSQAMVTFGAFLWHKISTRQGHSPSCPLASIASDTHRREFKLTYSGLGRMLSSAIEVSFALSWGAGGRSISPNITCRPTVNEETDPVFRILKLLSQKLSLLSYPSREETEFISECQARVMQLFLEKRSTPFATNLQNETFLYQLANVNRRIDRPFHRDPEPVNVLSGFWEALITVGVPVNTYNLRGESPMRLMDISHARYLLATNVYKVTCEVESELYPPWVESIYPKRGSLYSRVSDIFQTFKEVPGFAESYGCGPLSLAVLSNQIDRVKYLLELSPDTINERSLIGQTPLHLAVCEPDCLLLLLKAIPQSSESLNLLDNNLRSPLVTALYYSRENRNEVDCCDFGRSASLLLEADCAIPNPHHYSSSRIPIRVMSEFASHLANRRSRLKDFATKFISIIGKESVALRSDEILDSRAEEVESILAQHGIKVPTPLTTQLASINEDSSLHISGQGPRASGRRYCSVYSVIDSTDHADLFWDLGFRGLNSYNTGKVFSPLAVSLREYPSSGIIAYESWLLDHGADPLQPFTMLKYPSISLNTRDVPPEDIGITCAHAMLHSRASYVWHMLLGKQKPMPKDVESLKALNMRFSHLESPDKCNCACSVRGCTIQIQQLKSLVSVNDNRETFWTVRDLTRLYNSISWFYENLAATVPHGFHKDAIRFLTFTALGATHTCCQFISHQYWTTLPQDDVESIQEEEGAILELLESLLIDFEREISEILEIQPFDPAPLIGFWREYWFPKMRDVLADLSTDKLPEETKYETEELGVIWYGPERKEDAEVKKDDDRKSCKYWWDELDKIVAR